MFPLSLSRMASNSAGRAIDRAVKCAAHYETECVNSPEIGVSIPAGLHLRPRGHRHAHADRAAHHLPDRHDYGARRAHRARSGPREQTSGRLQDFNHTIKVEYSQAGLGHP